MNADHPSFDHTVAPDVGLRIDKICNVFERAWQLNQRPRIDDYLQDSSGEERLALLRELVALDIQYRLALDEETKAEDYLGRFPQLDCKWLDQMLTTASARRKPHSTAKAAQSTGQGSGASSGTRAKRLRCPHCKNPIQLSDDQSDQVLCPACGSGFRLCDTHTTDSLEPMKPLGKYQLLERVGLGGFGAVWRARDTELDRVVALKIPHSGLLTSPYELERWHREGRAAAQLRHPGIVAVHDVATLEGLPVIVSDYIAGVTLRDLLQVRRLGIREAAMLTAQMAEALEHAHSKGLVHRDIKPANIMLEREPDAQGGPETKKSEPANGAADARHRPLLMDFGLALRAEFETLLTHDGILVGTPAYMSPEQAAGRGHSVDGRCDVYSLGVVFYELLAGELPFRGSKNMILHQVLHEEPRPVRRLNDKVPRDLETICLKAMAKEPGRRYATAQDMAADLHWHLAGEPIKARPVGAGERTWRWCRRNRMVASLLATLAVVFIAGFAGVFGQWQRAEANYVEAVQAKKDFEKSADEVLKLTQDRLDEAKKNSARRNALREDYYNKFEQGMAALTIPNHEQARLHFKSVIDSITRDSEKGDADIGKASDVILLKNNATTELNKALHLKAALDKQNKLSGEVAEFRRLAAEMEYHAAGADAATEPVAFYDSDKAEQTGQIALDIVKRWTKLDLNSLSVLGHALIKQEIHDLLLHLVQAKSQRGQDADAKELLKLLERARELVGPSHSYHRLRARCFRLMGDEKQANAERSQAKATKAASALDHFLLGEDERVQALEVNSGLEANAIDKKRSHLKLAAAEYQRALDFKPGHFWALYQLGRCYLGLDRREEAAAVLIACMGLQPDSAWASTSSGVALALLGRHEEAIRKLTAPVVRDSDFLPAKLQLGVVYLLKAQMAQMDKKPLETAGNLKKAQDEFDAIVKLPEGERLVEAYYYKGQMCLNKREYAKAFREFDEVVRGRQDFAQVYLCRAQAHFCQEKPGPALKELTKYLQIVEPNAKGPALLALRGRLIRNWWPYWGLEGRAPKVTLDAACADLEKAVKDGYESATVYHDLGLIYTLLRPLQEAIKAFGKAIALAPADDAKLRAQLYNARGMAYAQLKPDDVDFAKGRVDFGKAIELDPFNAEFHSGLGYMLAWQGKTIEALKEAQLAALNDSNNYLVVLNVARIHGALAQYDKKNEYDHQTTAIAIIQQALNMWEKGGKRGPDCLDEIVRERRDFDERLRARPEFIKLTNSGGPDAQEPAAGASPILQGNDTPRLGPAPVASSGK